MQVVCNELDLEIISYKEQNQEGTPSRFNLLFKM